MDLAKKTIRVVVAAIINDGRILVAQRPYSDLAYKSFKWEFPGGKIESGETEIAAIKREIREELDCSIEVDSLLPEIEYEYPDFILRMTICISHLVDSSLPKKLEHNSILWLSADELASLDWAAADARCLPLILKKLFNGN